VWQSLPAKDYTGLTTEEKELLIKKLNAATTSEKRSREQFNYETAFISSALIQKFEVELQKTTRSKPYVTAQLMYLRTQVLRFFVGEKKLADPRHWPDFEAEWGLWLKGQKKSVSSIQRTIVVANKFLDVCSKHIKLEKSAGRFPLIILKPFGKAVIKKMRQLEERPGKFISDSDWAKIESSLSESILPAVQLAYYYGLRKSETLAVDEDCIYEDVLSVSRQLVKLNPLTFESLKTQDARDIPHWFCSPDKCYEIVSQLKRIHPTTLGHRFADEMLKLKMDYTIHDCRRTFITRALRIKHHRDVQLAVGHQQLTTTMIYAQDDRNLQRKKFKPKKA
jgi:integrase